METERRSTWSPSVENSFWKRLRTCRMTLGNDDDDDDDDDDDEWWMIYVLTRPLAIACMCTLSYEQRPINCAVVCAAAHV
jgi:hypothetical protein